jgi:hypothetical protein
MSARMICPKCENDYICNQCGCCQNCGLDVDSSEADGIEEDKLNGVRK